MKLKKMVSAGIAVATVTAGLTGCGTSSSNQSATADSNAAASSEGGEVTKPESIKFMTNVGLKSDDGFNEWVAEFTNKTGINLDFKYTEANEYTNKVELAFASGESADIFIVGNDKLANYAAQGALVDLTEMVNNSEIFQKVDKELMDSVTINGKIYGVPLEAGGGTVTYMRQDWLDQLGLEAPKNYEEFIATLRAFKTLGDDIIPFTAPGLVGNQAEYYLREFYQDATPEFVKVDGKWVDGMTQPNMVDALNRLRDAYAEGLLDMEVFTNKTSTCRDKWYSGNVGTFTYWAGNWAVTLENKLQNAVEGSKVTAIEPIAEAHYIKRVPAVYSISALAENPEGMFKYFLEYAADGGEGSMLFQHGVKDLHHTVDETTKEVKHLSRPSSPDDILEKAFVSPVLTDTPVEGYTFVEDERIVNTFEILNRTGVQAEIVPTSKTLAKNSSSVLALKESTVSSIVAGNVTVEEGLAKYQAEMANLGIDQIIEELNANN